MFILKHFVFIFQFYVLKILNLAGRFSKLRNVSPSMPNVHIKVFEDVVRPDHGVLELPYSIGNFD